MRFLFFILVITLISCKKQSTEFVFNEDASYNFLNEILIPKLKNENKSDDVLFAKQKLNSNISKHFVKIFNDSIINLEPIENFPFPLFEKKNWNSKKIQNIELVDMNIFFQNKINLEDIQKLKLYSKKNILIASEPVFDQNSKNLIIEIYYWEKDNYCGTESKRILIYLLKNEKWKLKSDFYY